MIKLDQFLKLEGLVSTGGEAKSLIQNEQVYVNGEIETRRGRKLMPGDIVELDDERLVVDSKFGDWRFLSGQPASGMHGPTSNTLLFW